MKNTKRKLIQGNILAEGEVTGHAHRVDVPVYHGRAGTRDFDGAATVTHEEHKHIRLPKNKWASGQVVELDPLTRMVSAVRD